MQCFYHLQLASDLCLCCFRKINNYTIYLDDPTVIKVTDFGVLYSVRSPNLDSSSSFHLVDNKNDYQAVLCFDTVHRGRLAIKTFHLHQKCLEKPVHFSTCNFPPFQILLQAVHDESTATAVRFDVAVHSAVIRSGAGCQVRNQSRSV